MTGAPWTPAEDALMDAALRECDSLDEAAARLTRETGREVSKSTMRNRALMRGIESPGLTLQRAKWQREGGQVARRDTPVAPVPAMTGASVEALDYEIHDTIGDAAPVLDTAAAARAVPSTSRPPAADRTFVEKPPASHEFEPLDCGSRTLERVLLLPDTHGPYHDKRAWSVAMRFAREFRPDTVVHLGDWADCFAVSDHDKDPRRASQLEEEMAIVRELRQEVDDLGAQRKVVTLGNHEDRLWRYCVRHAPALVSLMAIEGLLELPQHGWRVVPYRAHGSIGRMHLTHEAGFAGVHAVHHTGNAFASSVVFGHTHRLGASYFGDVTGKRYVSASLGWLGSMPAASYEHEAKRMRFWQHGFGTAHVERSGNFHLTLHPIVDGRVVLGGQLVDAA